MISTRRRKKPFIRRIPYKRIWIFCFFHNGGSTIHCRNKGIWWLALEGVKWVTQQIGRRNDPTTEPCGLVIPVIVFRNSASFLWWLDYSLCFVWCHYNNPTDEGEAVYVLSNRVNATILRMRWLRICQGINYLNSSTFLWFRNRSHLPKRIMSPIP